MVFLHEGYRNAFSVCPSFAAAVNSSFVQNANPMLGRCRNNNPMVQIVDGIVTAAVKLLFIFAVVEPSHLMFAENFV